MHVFAHRGVSGSAPENTRAAIELALGLPIFGVEVDVYACEDDYILTHDRWLTRTAGLTKRIDQMSLAELRATAVGSHAGEAQTIPTLADILEFDWHSHVLNLELKYVPDIEHFLGYLASHSKASDVQSLSILMSSFHHGYLDQIKRLAPQYELGWLTASYPLKKAIEARNAECQWFNIAIDVVDQAIVENAHKHGLKVAVYTVDEPADLAWLQQLGVDAVFCNHPGVANNYIQSLTD